MKNGDYWRQGTFEVTNAAQDLWSYAADEAKDPIDIMIQNTHATGIVYINLSGDAVADDTMRRIGVGELLKLENITSNISIIGSEVSNTIPYAYCKNAGRAK